MVFSGSTDLGHTDFVPVKSAFYSKINWVQAIAMAAQLLVFASGGAVNITPQDQVAIMTTIAVIHAVVTWVLRTWFNNSVTPSDAADNVLAARKATRGT